MRRIAMLAGLILTNVTLTASFAAAHPQQKDEESGDSRLSTSVSETPQPSAAGITWGQKEGRVIKSDSWFESAGKRFFSDQKEIWTSPARLRWTDAEWLVPVAGITAGMILTDRSFSRSLPNGPKMLHLENEVRTGSVAGLGVASGGMYLWSLHTHDPH